MPPFGVFGSDDGAEDGAARKGRRTEDGTGHRTAYRFESTSEVLDLERFVVEAGGGSLSEANSAF